MELHSTPQVARPSEQSRRITNNKPMMLKDYLWQDTSSADGFLAYPRRLPYPVTVRSLLELDHSSHGRPKLMRSSSKAASAAISKLHRASTLLLSAVKFIHHMPHLGNGGDSHRPSFLPRSLSRRLSKGKRPRKQVDHNLHTSMTVTVKDIMRWKSFTEANYMSPNKVLSPLLDGYIPSSKSDNGSSTTWSSCTWSDSDFSLELGSTCSSDFFAEQVGGYGGKRSPGRRERRREKKGVGEEEEESVVAPATYNRKPKVKGGEKGGSECSYEEKEQLSPVSVLDFPDEDGNSPSSSSSSSYAHFHSLANAERAKKKFMQKIRHFQSLAELEPANLESRLSECELYSPTSGGYNLSHDEEGEMEEEDHAKELLMSCILIDKEMQLTKADRELVLDFLSEGLRNGNASVEELVVVAEKWAIGRGGVAEGKWGVEDMREWHVKEMEGDGRWRTFGEEEAEVAAAVAMGVVEELIIELFAEG